MCLYHPKQIERKLRALGITVDTTIWKETSRKSRYHGLDDHLLEMQTDPDSICAIQLGRDDVKNKTATVHIFKNDLEGKIAKLGMHEYFTFLYSWIFHRMETLLSYCCRKFSIYEALLGEM